MKYDNLEMVFSDNNTNIVLKNLSLKEKRVKWRKKNTSNQNDEDVLIDEEQLKYINMMIIFAFWNG